MQWIWNWSPILNICILSSDGYVASTGTTELTRSGVLTLLSRFSLLKSISTALAAETYTRMTNSMKVNDSFSTIAVVSVIDRLLAPVCPHIHISTQEQFWSLGLYHSRGLQLPGTANSSL